MDRVIEVKVRGSYVTLDNQTAGVQGEVNSTALRIEFDSSWDGMAKTIVWWDAKGQNPTPIVLTADKLEDMARNIRTYLCPIPGEALAVMGQCMFAIDGYINGKRQKSVYRRMVVKGTGTGEDIVIEEPTPSQIEQLQAQIDTLLEDIYSAAEDASRIAATEAADAAAEAAARDAAEQAAGNVKDQLKDYTDRAESAAVRAEATVYQVTPQMYGAKADGVTDDTAVFQTLCGIENNVIFLPKGEYLIGGKVTFAKNVTLYGENACIIATNDTTFVLNRSVKVSGLSVALPAGYDGSLFEITNENLEVVSHDVLLNISVSDMEITCPLNYDDMANKEGTVFLVHAESGQAVTGYWGVTVKNITFKGGIKYFCRNYVASDAWITNVVFDNIYLNSCRYGWFSGENEETIETSDRTDVERMFISNLYMQSNQSVAVCYFKTLEKILTNVTDYDWPVGEVKFLLCAYAAKRARTLSIDHILLHLEEEFSFPALDENVSKYYVRKLIKCDRVRYVGNRLAKHSCNYRGEYRLFATSNGDEYKYYETTAVMLTSAQYRLGFTVYDYKVHNITLNMIYAGGHWYTDVCCDTDYTNICDFYFKAQKIEATENDADSYWCFTIKLIFSKQPEFVTGYWSPAFGDYSSELIFDKSDATISGFTKMNVMSQGAFLPAVTTSYSPFRTTGCETNHIAQRDNAVVYKTANAVEERVPKIRKGTITLSATEQNVTFDDVVTSDYIVMTNPPVSDLEVTNKTATGFAVKSATASGSVMWVLIG